MKLKTMKPKKIEEIMAILTPSFPLLALKNATLFPLTVLPLRVLRASTMQAVEKALLTDGVMLALSENANINGSEPLLRRYAKVGTLAKV
ncbi:MAG: LON peptidase substrate-binding domain-containing protein, partial [Bdellovibrionales bacterium]|nr:LON peptidase substrate-binding domain-containing protein [Oligoflexia bacterium]